ncbi:MAG TPA: SpoIIE family protein phosphatase [Bacteroidales bacterium]|nr:SpoIIE family protein phosphatase [Bacteroidales bacterium]
MEESVRDNADLLSKGDYQGLTDHLASLRYAWMIQQALLPAGDVLGGLLTDHFVLFLPRDIVSGDFYYAWADNGFICVAAGDCTGHGVPGALMSILGISFLNEIFQCGVRHKANRVLNMMREKVMKALHQTGDLSTTKDSIDIGICIIDKSSGKMQYAGANRPLIRIRNGEITEFRPDLMTIGVAPLREVAFTNNIIDLKKGDMFYLFSDGFTDQFGAVTNKKFKHANFRKLLESVSDLSPSEQKNTLEKAFYEWKGEEPQVDDVLIFGFKI